MPIARDRLIHPVFCIATNRTRVRVVPEDAHIADIEAVVALDFEIVHPSCAAIGGIHDRQSPNDLPFPSVPIPRCVE